MKRLPATILILAAVLFAIGLAGKYADLPDIIVPTGSITQLVVVEETKDRISEQGDVLLGKTSQEARKRKKWKLFDKDHLPRTHKPLIDQAPPKVLPWLIVDKKTKAVWSGKLPETEKALADLVKKQGGF